MTNEELVLAIRAGQNVTDNMTLLYNQNLPMIRKVVKKYAGIEDVEDLTQESYLSLVRAVDLWDPEREAKFLTFLMVCLRTDLYRYITDCGALIRIPGSQKTLMHRYDRIMTAYRVELGRDATPDEIRVLLDISKDQFEQLKKDRLTTKIRSTSEIVGGDDDDLTLEDYLPAEGDLCEDVVDRIQQEQLARELWGQVDQLPEREADVIRGKYQQGMTYTQCGDELGISPERVRQLHERALRKLRGRKVTKRLAPYLSDSMAYSIGTHSGLASFRYSHTTGQERAVMLLEERIGPIWQNVAIEEEQT